MLDLDPGTETTPRVRPVRAASSDAAVQYESTSALQSTPESYAFLAALRPFSLVVAFVSCGLGILLAVPQGPVETGLALAVMLGGLLLQCGVNLINDREDLDFLRGECSGFDALCAPIERNFRIGLLSFAAAAAIGLGIAWVSGPAVLVIGLVGVFGAFAYTHEPFNYKRRGLGVLYVFVLMGVLMVQGAYIAISGDFSLTVLLHSLPISALVSLLLLSNEIRDLEKDAARGMKTLSVKIGYNRAVGLYWLLIAAAYGISALLVMAGELALSPWLLLPLPLLPLLKRYLSADDDRAPLTPWTGRFLLLFGVGYALALA